MYTHSVISQRSLNRFYFLVKPTSLHTTSPAPIFAIQMYIQTAGHPKRFIPVMLLFLFFFSRFKVKYLSFGIFYALLWSLKGRKFLFLALSLENHEGRGTMALSEVANRVLEDHQIHTADGKMAQKQLFSPNYGNMSTYWHIQKLGSLAGKMLIQVEEDTGTSSLTFENICFKFTAYMLQHSVVYAALFWRSGPFSKSRKPKKVFYTQ